jgi:DNA-binding transcriptional LysR family regulator
MVAIVRRRRPPSIGRRGMAAMQFRIGWGNIFRTMNWDDLRIVLAVARQGSLSAAARSLRLTQPTVGRRVAALEAKLGTKLFVATRLGQEVSHSGRELVAHAEQMELSALAAERSSLGRDSGMRGNVCVTATEWMVGGVLARLVAPFTAKHPELELELLADVRHLSLMRREADIALRVSRFEDGEVIQRKVGVVAFGLYASDSYLARHGAPSFSTGCPGHRLIAMSKSLGKVPDVEWLPALTFAAHVALRTNGREPMATLAKAGVGMACLPRLVGDRTPGLRLLRTPSPAPERALWLGVHRDARKVPRIRATAAFLAQALARSLSRQVGH